MLDKKDQKSSVSTFFTSSGLNLYISKTEQYCTNLFNTSKTIANQHNREIIGEEDVQSSFEVLNAPKKSLVTLQQIFLGTGSFVFSQSLQYVKGEDSEYWIPIGIASIGMIILSFFLRKY